eukprot:gene8778-1153_t
MPISPEYVDEVENLIAIFESSIHIHDGCIEMTVVPDVDATECFVRTDLFIEIPDAYPKKPSRPSLRKVRGLTIEQQKSIQQSLDKTATDCAQYEMPAIFELFQCTRDILDKYNNTTVDCSICFETVPPENRCRTPCFHFFHKECLARFLYFWKTDPQDVDANIYQQARRVTQSREEALEYIRFSKAKAPVPCPVCRNEMTETDLPIVDWRHIPPYEEIDTDVRWNVEASKLTLSKTAIEQQRKRQQIFLHQHAKNALIEEANVTYH